jgi:multidrug efflux pump subunit AcrB
MDKLARFVIERARFSLLLIFSVLVAGFTVYQTQPRQEDPEIKLRGAQVVAQFPGLSPERVEQLLILPIEAAIKEIPEIKEIKSLAMTGTAIISPEVDSQFDDLDPIWTTLRNKMEDLQSSLPDGTQGPFVNDDFGEVAVITLALTGEDYSMAELADVAADVGDSISTLPLVAGTDLYGVQEETIWLELNPDFMAQLDLTTSAVAQAIRGQNVVMSGGTINADGQNVVIEPSGDFESLDQLRNLPISTKTGGLVYLQDLATIRRAYVDPPKSPAFFNNKPAVVLGISMIKSSNVVELGHQVTERLASIRPQLPIGMNLDVAIFQPDLVEQSVSSATNNLLQTVAVVLVIVMLFLGWRTGLIVGAMVPLTMMVTLVGMSVWGIELHRISIAAIIVALGLLVDNGVVVAEEIRQRLDRGVDRMEAVLATPRSLAIPLLTSSLTTVIAFMPLVLIQDTTGEFLRSLGQVLSIALLASWLLAITVTPAMCYWFLGDHDAATEPDERAEGSAYLLYRRGLGWALSHRLVIGAVVVALLFATGQVFQVVKQRSLGPSERNQFVVYVDLPAEAAISATIEATRVLSAFLSDKQRNPEVTEVLSYVGSGGPRFFLALSPNDPQPNKAFIVVNTETDKQIQAVMRRTDRFFDTDLPQASGRSDVLFLGPAPLGTVELRVVGQDISDLRRTGLAIRNVFHDVPGIQAVRADWENSVMKVVVEIDQERARRNGITSEQVATTLSGFFDGTVITNYREDDKVIPVSIRASAENRNSLDRLRTIELLSANGIPVPLIQIARFEGEIEPSRIRRVNQERALSIFGKHPDMTAVELHATMEEKLDQIELPPGVRVELEGEIKGAAESNSKLLGFAPHALFLIVLLLVLQFDSFRRPAIILLTIPLVIVGAIFGLAIFRAYFDFTAMLGLFSLAGIIINNGIVMIDRIDQNRGAGHGVHDSIIEAAVTRARPIIMTTITTVIGLMPLALFGGEFWYGMAIVIMCGLAVGTLLTLIYVPVLYSAFFGKEATGATAS